MVTLREPIISLTTAVILPLRSYRSITIIQLTSLVIGRSRSVAPLPTPYSLLPTPYSLLPVPLAIADNHCVRIIFPKTYTLSKRQYIHIAEILNIAVEWSNPSVMLPLTQSLFTCFHSYFNVIIYPTAISNQRIMIRVIDNLKIFPNFIYFGSLQLSGIISKIF
ncbi:MAG: hypothetical protein F6K26_10850 [Moorea sp. SIO2I5]|nr:hypothetical protein [Moorena sp. SIO2I5]